MLDFNNFSLTNYGFQLVFDYHPSITYPATNHVNHGWNLKNSISYGNTGCVFVYFDYTISGTLFYFILLT